MTLKQIKLTCLFLFIWTAPHLGNTPLILLQSTIFLLTFYIKPDKEIRYRIKWLLLPLSIGIFNGIITYSFYDCFKDLYYFLNPILYTYAGAIMLKKFPIKDILFSIVFAGSLFSIFAIYTMLNSFGFNAIIDPRSARETLSLLAYDITSISILIIICDKFIYNLNLFQKKYIESLLLCINSFALYLSASRTDILLLFIGLILILYCNSRQKFTILMCTTFVLLILIFLIKKNDDTPYGKAIAKIPNEIAIKPAENMDELNNNYRGHEAYMTLRTLRRGSIENRIFGMGLGATVDMGKESPLILRHIPIIHNGYAYILFKVGWFGLIIYTIVGLSLSQLSIKKGKKIPEDSLFLFMKHLSITLVISIYIINISVSGIFNPRYVILWVLYGSAIQYKIDYSYGRINNYH